jgi:hypothetical protein
MKHNSENCEMSEYCEFRYNCSQCETEEISWKVKWEKSNTLVRLERMWNIGQDNGS